MSDSRGLTVGLKGAEMLGFAPLAQWIEHRKVATAGAFQSDIAFGGGGTPGFAPNCARAPLPAWFSAIPGVFGPERNLRSADRARVWA